MSDNAASPTADSLLDYYHCTFFLPLSGLPDDFPKPDARYRKTYPSGGEGLNDTDDVEAFLFFTPTLRAILFDQGDTHPSPGSADSDHLRLEPVQEWALDAKEYADWVLTLEATEEENAKVLRHEMPRELCV